MLLIAQEKQTTSRSDVEEQAVEILACKGTLNNRIVEIEN